MRLPAIGGEAACAAEVNVREVERVEVEAGRLTCEMEVLGAGPDLSPIRVNFSARLSTAAARSPSSAA